VACPELFGLSRVILPDMALQVPAAAQGSTLGASNWGRRMLMALAVVIVGVVGIFFGSLRNQQKAVLVLGTPNAVTVARYGPTAGFPPRAPERVVTETSSATVARLVTDANSLPLFPSGTIHCPFDDGSYYQVGFSYADGDSRTLHVQRRGCQGVGFAERPDYLVAWLARDPRLLNDLDALFR
jgi:hypothetical protein